ncbi:hypothetical protein DL765_005532 [Monosporascus sp. GIB2]|nr:hypothetical protein DL765_005532 [Monosporascus sp. GIB2]
MLPRRLVMPPQAWVPKVAHGETMPAAHVKTTYTKEQETITETKFNASTSAEVTIEARGSYYGITASVKSSNELSFKYSSSTMRKESLEIKGTSGNVPIHQLSIYPPHRLYHQGQELRAQLDPRQL